MGERQSEEGGASGVSFKARRRASTWGPVTLAGATLGSIPAAARTSPAVRRESPERSSERNCISVPDRL
jgi:hypothetical protein